MEKKRSAMTKVCKAFLLFIIFSSVGLILYAIIAGSGSGDAVGWFIWTVLMGDFLIIPYYVIIYFISAWFDKKNMHGNVIKNVILSILLLLPAIAFMVIYFTPSIRENLNKIEVIDQNSIVYKSVR